jgi:uncharacterized protein (DUF488 family)
VSPLTGGAPHVWTIGHSTRALGDFVALLAKHGIGQLVDVRTIPRSRHNPQFNRETLTDTLVRAGVVYAHMPALGGLRRPRADSTNTGWRNAGFRGYADYMETTEFEQNLAALIGLAGRHATAIMCAEAVPWRCHRSLIADALTARNLRVTHILGAGAAREHVLTPWARADGARLSYAAPGEPPRLI